MTLALTDEDRLLRKLVVINQGNLLLVSEQLGLTYSQVISTLRRKRNRRWWKSNKAKFSRRRASNSAMRTLYRKKFRAIEPYLLRQLDKDIFP